MSGRVKLFVGAGGTLALLAIVLAGLMATGTVLAQTPPAGSQAAGQPKPAGLAQEFLSKLARNLGVGEDKLKEAVKNTETQIVDERLQQGKITKDQADKLRERIQKSEGLAPFGLVGPRVGAPVVERFRRSLVTQAISDTAQLLNMGRDDVQKQLREGKTLSEVAASKGMNRADLVNGLAGKTTGRINQLVKDGKLTQDQANTLIEGLPQALGRIVDMKHPAARVIRPRPIRPMVGHALRQTVADAAQLLNMSNDDVVTQLREGKSLAEVAASKNMSRQQLIDGLVAKDRERIQQRLKDGKLTQGQADTLIARLPDVIGRAVDAKLNGPNLKKEQNQRPQAVPNPQGPARPQPQRQVPRGLPFRGAI